MFSFTTRKKTVDAQRYIRRLIDLTIPNNAATANSERFENRCNRVLPVLLCPWEKNAPVVSKRIVVVTKDIGDRGVGLVLNHAFDANEVVVAFCLQTGTAAEPWFFRGTNRANMAIGGGFWLLGIQLVEFMNETWAVELEPLLPMARDLLPPSHSGSGDSIAAAEALVGQAISLS
jgi:hypothetical protein